MQDGNTRPTGNRWFQFRGLGPGLLVTAAFIGPGTVTTASKAGVQFGVALLWTVLLAVIVAIVLQQMASRLGLISRRGLGDAIRQSFPHPLVRGLACGLVVVAIFFGNTAYQTGNLMGAVLGLQLVMTVPVWPAALLIGSVAAALLWSGSYRWIQRVLVALVVVMSLVFLATAMLVRPDFGTLLQGMVVPRLPAGSMPLVIAMIGTTVVPYNLFLHASAVQQRWPNVVPGKTSSAEAIAESRADTVLSISLGGLVTAAIVIAGSAAQGRLSQIQSASEMAQQLEPLLGGSFARVLFAVGLFAAGLTSAITAPLAAAYATTGALGYDVKSNHRLFRVIWATVLVTGTVLAVTLGRSPTETILVAQIANGLLLPVIAVFLMVAVNRRVLMGRHVNSLAANVAGLLAVLLVSGLGIYHVVKRLLDAFGG